MEITTALLIKDEIKNKFDSEKQLSNWLLTSQKNKKIVRIRNNFYALLDPLTKTAMANKYQIASKITPSAFLSHHAAIEYYGLANQVYNCLTVSSTTHFNEFEFEGINYNYQRAKNDDFVVSDFFGDVRVTSRERTIIDIIENIDLSGGIEEVLHFLEGQMFIKYQDMLDILTKRNNNFLWQKVGYLLEFYQEQLQLPKVFFEECLKNITTKKIRYFLDRNFRKLIYQKKWRIMAPKNPISIIFEGHDFFEIESLT